MIKEEWKAYLRLYRPALSRLILICVFSITASILMVPVAFAIRHIFDHSIVEKNTDELIFLGVILIVLHVLSKVLLVRVRYVSLSVTKKIIASLRELSIEKLYSLSKHFYTHSSSSSLHNVIVQDTERIDIMSNAIVALILPSALIVLMLIPVLIMLNPELFIVLLILFPVVFLFSKLLTGKARKSISAFHHAFEIFSGGILFVLRAMDLTRILSAQEFEKFRNSKNIDSLRKESMRMAWLMTGVRQVQDGILIVINVIVLIVGGMSVIRGSMSLGDVISFFAVLMFLHRQIAIIVTNLPMVVEGNVSLSNLFDFLNNNDTEKMTGEIQISELNSLSLKDISFSYGNIGIFNGLNFGINRGEVVVITGPSGSGKTTLVNLILGFYSPDAGSISVNGLEYDTVNMNSIRKCFGVVQQEPVLFADKVKANIVYSQSLDGDAELIKAAESAMAHDFIHSLPEGYNTVLGKDGESLSGGQKQRIAIARALFHNPDFLILDEPTNHLDRNAMSSLLMNIKGLGNKKAVLIISHEPAVMDIADKIYRIEDGKLGVVNG